MDSSHECVCKNEARLWQFYAGVHAQTLNFYGHRHLLACHPYLTIFSRPTMRLQVLPDRSKIPLRYSPSPLLYNTSEYTCTSNKRFREMLPDTLHCIPCIGTAVNTLPAYTIAQAVSYPFKRTSLALYVSQTSAALLVHCLRLPLRKPSPLLWIYQPTTSISDFRSAVDTLLAHTTAQAIFTLIEKTS